MILNGLPRKRTETILSFLRLHPSTAFRTLVDHDGCSISSKSKDLKAKLEGEDDNVPQSKLTCVVLLLTHV